jgi:hypothetical protein
MRKNTSTQSREENLKKERDAGNGRVMHNGKVGVQHDWKEHRLVECQMTLSMYL